MENNNENEHMVIDNKDNNISQEKAQLEKKEYLFECGDINIDISTYASNYIGNNKINKLLFLAQQCKEFINDSTNKAKRDKLIKLQYDAYAMAIESIKETTFNIKKYLNTLEKLNDIAKSSSMSLPIQQEDQEWIRNTKLKINKKQEAIEKISKSSENNEERRENIRRKFKEQGDLNFQCGDYQSAIKFYLKNKDYNTCFQHMVDMYLDVIKIYFEQNDYLYLQTYISKAENTISTNDKKSYINKLKCCSGLAALHQEKFKLVARLFSELNFDMDNLFLEILSPNDIAIYGGLCALATFDRSELKNKIIDNTKFKQFLELEPQILELILSFYNSKYTQMIEIMNKMLPELYMDKSLKMHVRNLYKTIREKALVQYFSPFKTVDMNKMAKSFNISVSALQNELVELIAKDLINARIDSQNKILYAKNSDQRNDIFEKTLKMGEKNCTTIKNLLLRMKMEEVNMIVSSNSNGVSGEESNISNIVLSGDNAGQMNLSPLDTNDFYM